MYDDSYFYNKFLVGIFFFMGFVFFGMVFKVFFFVGFVIFFSLGYCFGIFFMVIDFFFYMV